MNNKKVYVYISPKADIQTYPETLTGDMSVFRQARSIQHEVQWVIYLMLKDQGWDVRICHGYPASGILVIHRSHVKKFVWNPDLFVVSLQWDYKRDDRAQIHLVSNYFKTSRNALGWLDRISFKGLQYYIPPIMHPVIIPRDRQRGDTFENIAFIGDPKNLDDAFKTKDFVQAVQEMGMRFIIRSEPQEMPDYSDVDAVIAIRKIGRVITNKPPTKLINAWRGGVPSLLGCEIGFREARQSEYDYIEVDSVDDVISGLERLKTDIKFRKKMIENAMHRAQPYSADGQRQIWIDFFRSNVIPAFDRWNMRFNLYKFIFLSVRRLRFLIRVSLAFVWHRVLRRRFSDYS